MIAVIDYDMGNLRSVANALKSLGADVMVTRQRSVIESASHVVLPGVGAFKDCISNLIDFGLVDPVLKSIETGKPFLGICLGLQVLFEEGLEFGSYKGLGILKGQVVRFNDHMAGSDGTPLKIPHMGWNDIKIEKESALLKGIPEGSYFYFVHSYCARPSEPEAVNLTTTEYGVRFTSAIEVDNIMALQFHPEKSQRLGLKILKNFMDLKY
ncbi:MAG: imidazole glycerol phosphate synthase subunit HisH [Thermodesulfobacteriota bacterium]